MLAQSDRHKQNAKMHSNWRHQIAQPGTLSGRERKIEKITEAASSAQGIVADDDDLAAAAAAASSS